MDELVLWLGEQLDEDEQIARAADADLSNLTGWVEIEYPETKADEAHALRHSPARVLREIDAKRRILAECTYWNGKLNQEASNPPTHPYPCLGEILDAVNPILRALALPYADRDGYREEWAP